MLSRFIRHNPRLPVLFARRNGTRASSHCPSCGAPLPTALPTCPTCNLPTAEPVNPFVIDTRDLRTRFLQTQRLCHPDIWAQNGQKEQTLAAAQSSQLNKAYQTLLSPLDRAHYILSLHGVKESETEKLEDAEFIMEVMEARQEIEEASNAEDIHKAKAVNQGRINGTVKEIERMVGRKDWNAARQATVKLKYWLGIESAAKEWAPR